MIVSDVSYLNLEELYDISVRKEEDSNYHLKQFGRNLPQLYGHIEIRYYLKEVNSLEYVFLKMMSSCITKLKYEDFGHYFGHSYVEKSYPEIYGQALMPYLDYIQKENLESLFFPIGVEEGECIVTFRGVELVSLIGMDPRDFFIKASKRICIIPGTEKVPARMDHSFKKRVESDETLKNSCIELLLTHLYKFMTDKLTYVDIPSESFNRSVFGKKNDSTNPFQLVAIRNPWLTINLEKTETARIVSLLNMYQKENLTKEFTLQNTLLEFRFSTLISQFIDLFRLVPYDKFISMDNFIIPMKENLRTPDHEITKSTNVRITEKTYEYIRFFNEQLKTVYDGENPNPLKCADLIKKSTMFDYTLLLSFNDINALNAEFRNEENSNVRNSIGDLIKSLTTTSLSFANAMI